jgi:hypothetical protein
VTRRSGTRYAPPPQPGFARREAATANSELQRKKGAHGGNMVSPVQNNLPIYVFELAEGNIRRVVAGERVGTLISTPKEP